MKLTPKQHGIVNAMTVIMTARDSSEYSGYHKLGVAQIRGMRKEMALIYNRLGARLPKEVPWNELSVDNGE